MGLNNLTILLLGAFTAGGLLGCGPAIRRDLSVVPPGQVGFDDMCGLQEYFDRIAAKGSEPPTVVTSMELGGAHRGKAIRGGRERLAFEGEIQLRELRRVLNENWRHIPDELSIAERIEVEVRWSEQAGIRRVAMDDEAQLFIGHESWGLPYHPCLSELLYGQPLYRERRIMWGVPVPEDMPLGSSVLRPVSQDAATADAVAATPQVDAGPISPIY